MNKDEDSGSFQWGIYSVILFSGNLRSIPQVLGCYWSGSTPLINSVRAPQVLNMRSLWHNLFKISARSVLGVNSWYNVQYLHNRAYFISRVFSLILFTMGIIECVISTCTTLVLKYC